PELTQVLMTIGLTFCIIGIANYLMGPTLKTIPLPAALQGSADLGFRTIPVHRLFVILCGLAVALALWFAVDRTSFGVKLRASVDDAAMAAAL
ncbi:branched-chain amino acid ABC transporter permease, partial [Rhizobium ruizarguesonis]